MMPSVSFDLVRRHVYHVQQYDGGIPREYSWNEYTATCGKSVVCCGCGHCQRDSLHDTRRLVAHRARISTALFEEQERQRKLGIKDSTLLAEICRGYSQLSESEAQRRARQLVECIAACQDKDDHECEISSRRSTLSTMTCEDEEDATSVSVSQTEEDALERDDGAPVATHSPPSSPIEGKNSNKLEQPPSRKKKGLARRGRRLWRNVFGNNS